MFSVILWVNTQCILRFCVQCELFFDAQYFKNIYTFHRNWENCNGGIMSFFLEVSTPKINLGPFQQLIMSVWDEYFQ